MRSSIEIFIRFIGFILITSQVYFCILHPKELTQVAAIFFVIGILCVVAPNIFNDLVRRTRKIGSAEFELRDLAQEIREIRKEFESINEQGTSFINHKQAFTKLAEKTEEILKQEPEAIVDFRLIAIAMRYSKEFMAKTMIDLATRFPRAQLRWHICLTSPEYLAQLLIDNKEYNWLKQAHETKEYLSGLLQQMKARQLPPSLIVEPACYFDAIPQWHGVLIEVKSMSEYHLYFGRTDWRLPRNKTPILEVGSNEYRYFNYKSAAGIRKINLFRHWFSVYATWDSIVKPKPSGGVEGLNETALVE